MQFGFTFGFRRLIRTLAVYYNHTAVCNTKDEKYKTETEC